MRNLVTGQQMKRIDQYTIEEIGVPSLVLQERAALWAASEVKKRVKKGTRVWAVCGTGNNGADAIAAARILDLWGYPATLVLAGDREKETEECRIQRNIAKKLGILDVSWQEAEELEGVILDGLFGVGLTREIEGEFRQCIQWAASQPAVLTVAIDIPSGIHSDRGTIMGAALKADVTVTFGWEKCGTVLFPGREYAGEVVIGDIGFPALAYENVMLKNSQEQNLVFTYEPEDLSLLPQRPEYSNKGTFGHVLIVAGSRTMSLFQRKSRLPMRSRTGKDFNGRRKQADFTAASSGGYPCSLQSGNGLGGSGGLWKAVRRPVCLGRCGSAGAWTWNRTLCKRTSSGSAVCSLFNGCH